MRTIDANMQTALAAKTRKPAVGLTVEDHTIHLSAYQFPGLADQWSDCCVANDGSIIRVNLTRTGLGLFQGNFQHSRITDPSVASQWIAVTSFSGMSNNMYVDGGCAVSNNNGTLRAFAQRGTGGNNLWVWTSTDNGVTWSGPVTVVNPPANALTKGIGSSGNNEVFFLYDVLGGDAMGFCRFSAGAWSALTTWTLQNTTDGAGVAVYWTGSLYNLVYSDGYTVSAATYDGTTWTQGNTIASATSVAVARISPRLAFFGGLYHLCLSESDNGTISGSVYQYCRVRESGDFVHWSDGWIAHETSNKYGGNYFSLAAPQSGSSGPRYYLATISTVLSTPAYNQANSSQYLDISNAVLSYKRIERVNKPAELEVLLDNQGGVYNSLLNLSGGTAYQPITPGATLKLTEGYLVGTPPTTPDTILTGTYRLMKVAVLRSPQQHQIQLIGLDLTERLDRIVRWQNIFGNETIRWLLLEVCARAGIFNPQITGGSQLTQVVPAFVIHANQKYRSALDALCTAYGLDYFLDQNEVLQIREIQASDPSVWSSQNEIEMVSFGADFNRANHVVASGKPPSSLSNPYALTTAESYDDTASAAMRVERLFHHTDFKTTTSAQAQIAANLVLYTEQRAQVDTRLVVPLNPALQLIDVITVTDAPAPTGSGQSTVGRIIKHEAIFDATKAEYESRLSLQGH